jgi:hypothetical protein
MATIGPGGRQIRFRIIGMADFSIARAICLMSREPAFNLDHPGLTSIISAEI